MIVVTNVPGWIDGMRSRNCITFGSSSLLSSLKFSLNDSFFKKITLWSLTVTILIYKTLVELLFFSIVANLFPSWLTWLAHLVRGFPTSNKEVVSSYPSVR